MRTHMEPLHSIVGGYNGKEACSGVALGRLWSFCYAELYHAKSFLFPSFSHSLAYFPLWTLIVLEFICFLLLFFLPLLSVCLTLLSQLYPRHDRMDVGT